MIYQRKWQVLPLVLALMLAACKERGSNSAGGSTTEEPTQRQRDSILAQSSIPGARGVGSAMRAADATSAGIRAADTVSP